MRIKCDFFRIRIMAQFHALAEYTTYVDGQIQDSHHSTRCQILADNRGPSEKSDKSVQLWLAERQLEIDECDRRFAVDFRRLLRFTVIVATYTLVESSLLLISQEIAKRMDLSLAVSDLRAKDLVSRFRKFWTKVAGLRWFKDIRWERLRDIQELRNCIAHRNGVIRENDGRIKTLLTHDLGVRLVDANDWLVDPNEAGTLEFEERFCRLVLEEMTGLFVAVFDNARCFGPDHVVVEPE